MNKETKTNTVDEIIRRKEKLETTLNETHEVSEELYNYEFSKHGLLNYANNFLESKKVITNNEKLSDNDQLGLDLTERVYRLTSKAVKMIREEKNPETSVKSMFDIMKYVEDNKQIINLMNTLSDSMTLDQEANINLNNTSALRVLTSVFENCFPLMINNYQKLKTKIDNSNIKNNIREEKLSKLKTEFVKEFRTYTNNIRQLSYQVMDVEEIKTNLYDLACGFLIPEEQKECTDKQKTISEDEFKKLSRNGGLKSLKEKYGKPTSITYTRNINKSSRKVHITTYKDGFETNITVNFQKNATLVENDFAKTIGNDSQLNLRNENIAKFLGTEKVKIYKNNTSTAIKRFEKGYLADR